MVGRCVVAYALFGMLCGCGTSAPVEAGPKGTYDRHCAKCHARAGEPGGPGVGGSKGPKIGAITNRPAGWIADYIRDPKSQKPDSKMPAFGGTLTDDEVRELAAWLAAKK